MKIGIITFNSAHNYGAVLQVWALQERLREEGHQVEVINYRPDAIDKVYQIFVPKRISGNDLVNRGCHKLQFMKAKLINGEKAKRYKKFEKFIREELPTTKPYHTYEALKHASFDYDMMITGSDQVWNGNITKGINGAYFLGFGDPKIKRVSYAASIGKECFDPEEKAVVAKFLKDLDYISVREEKAKVAVEELTDKPVDLVLDPTLLLDKERYNKIHCKTDYKGDYIFVHNVHLVKVDARLNAVVEEISKRTGLPVVSNRGDYTFSNECGKFTSGSPGEFLGVIEGAKFVITNSFHATVFSTIYEKNFITVPHFKNPDRMRNLLHMFELDNHLISDVSEIPKDLSTLEIDYAKVKKMRKEARVSSEAYLKKILTQPKTVPATVETKNLYARSKDKFACYGCGLCKTACPEKIQMQMDEEGIFYPVMQAEEACVKNEQVCLFGKETNTQDVKRAYVGHLKDEVQLENCAGGGVKRALAEAIWKQGGVVAGSGFKDSLLPEYFIATSMEEANGFFSEKYVEELTNDIFEQVKCKLEEGIKVLFLGKPCKIDALKHYLGKVYENLYTVQDVCRGISSRKVYEKYLEGLEKNYESKVAKVEFENKAKTAKEPYVCITFESGDLLASSVSSNLFVYAMKRGYAARYSCTTCKYRTEGRTIADIVISKDSLRSEEESYKMGEDMVYICSDKGQELLDAASKELVMYTYTGERNLVGRLPLSEGRHLLLSKMNNGEDIEESIRFNRQKKK